MVLRMKYLVQMDIFHLNHWKTQGIYFIKQMVFRDCKKFSIKSTETIFQTHKRLGTEPTN